MIKQQGSNNGSRERQIIETRIDKTYSAAGPVRKSGVGSSIVLLRILQTQNMYRYAKKKKGKMGIILVTTFSASTFRVRQRTEQHRFVSSRFGNLLTS